MNARPFEDDPKPGARDAFEMEYRNHFVPHSKHLFMILHLFTALAPTPIASLFLVVLLKQNRNVHGS